MRRFLSFLLAAALLLMPVQSLAEGDLIVLDWIEEPTVEVIELVPEVAEEVQEAAVEEPAEEIVLALMDEAVQEVASELAPEEGNGMTAEEAPVLYTDLVLNSAYAMAGLRGMSWQV